MDWLIDKAVEMLSFIVFSVFAGLTWYDSQARLRLSWKRSGKLAHNKGHRIEADTADRVMIQPIRNAGRIARGYVASDLSGEHALSRRHVLFDRRRALCLSKSKGYLSDPHPEGKGAVIVPRSAVLAVITEVKEWWFFPSEDDAGSNEFGLVGFANAWLWEIDGAIVGGVLDTLISEALLKIYPHVTANSGGRVFVSFAATSPSDEAAPIRQLGAFGTIERAKQQVENHPITTGVRNRAVVFWAMYTQLMELLRKPDDTKEH